MASQTIACPTCQHQMDVEGEPGERLLLTCPQCKAKGFFFFPSQTGMQLSMGNVIDIRNLSKYYGKIKGIDKLSLTVKKGEIFGFLGPNGAGKTTTIRTLLGYLKPTNGEAYIFGRNIKDNIVDIKANVGYIPGDLNLYNHLTGKQFLDYFIALRNKKAVLLPELLEIFSVPLNRPIKGYSKGMKQKLGIIQAFMDDPEIVIMDEPTSGLDPLLQQSFYDFLKREKKKGRTMFFSSHVLSEVDKICDRVGIIRDGSLITVENIESLKKKKGKILRVKIMEDPTSFPGPEDMTVEDGWIQFTVKADIDQWIKKLCKYTILDLKINEFSMEDIFIHYYKVSA